MWESHEEQGREWMLDAGKLSGFVSAQGRLWFWPRVAKLFPSLISQVGKVTDQANYFELMVWGTEFTERDYCLSLGVKRRLYIFSFTSI